MALDLRYVLFTPLQQLFVDGTSGQLLSSGYLLFFQDSNRSLPQKVYKLTGSPPNYSYIEYGSLDIATNGWKVNINDVGALDDNLYLYPYDSSDDISLYFVQAYNSGSVFQFSREGIPNVEQGGVSQSISKNFAPNGQFLLHYDIPASSANHELEGEISTPVTIVAQGGWTFERPISSASTDFVLFERFGSAVTNPASTPRYAARVKCTVPDAGDTFKDLRLKFKGVNTFSSDTDMFTIGLSGISNGAGAINASLVLIKYFGTGGSSTQETVLTTLTIPTSFTNLYTSFTFGSNASFTIGLNDDDYIQLALRYPVNSGFDISITDFILAEGNITRPIFPYTPEGEMVNQSLGNGSQITSNEFIGLPVLNGINGFEFDTSAIGKVFQTIDTFPSFGELLCDGSQYETSAVSPDGIPYSRLQKKIYSVTDLIPIFGTGLDFVTAFGYEANLILSTNKQGAVPDPTNGLPSPGFTFTNIVTSPPISTAPVNINASYQNNPTLGAGIVAVCKLQGAFFGGQATAGTTGFLVGSYDQYSSYPFTLFDVPQNISFSHFVLYINSVVISTLSGKYFLFSNTIADYYLWFKVDGAGADPGVAGRTGIQVNLLSTYSSEDVSQIIAMAINYLNVTNILTVAASTIPAGSYFNFSSPADEYYAWFTIDGVGTDPTPSGKKPVKVDLLTADTAEQVLVKIVIAINSKYFRVPDYRGIFLKGWNSGSNNDPGAPYRVSQDNAGLLCGDNIGTFEYDSNRAHVHDYFIPESNNVGAPSGGYVVSDFLENAYYQGNQEGSSTSRPRNSYINFVIKY